MTREVPGPGAAVGPRTGNHNMKVLLSLLVTFVITDGLLTELLLSGGRAREGNPLLAPLVGNIGFIVLKVVGSLVCAFILWDIYRRFPRMALIAAWFFVIAYGAVVIWNSGLLILI